MSTKIHSDALKNTLRTAIGSNARAARKALDLTQDQAADRIGVSAEFYARIERGNALPSVDTLARMAPSLNISADQLLDTEGPLVPASDTAPKLSQQRQYILDRVRDDKDRIRLVTALLKALEPR